MEFMLRDQSVSRKSIEWPLEKSFFLREGVSGPISLFTPAQCDLVLQHLCAGSYTAADWEKGRAVTDRFLYEVATQPALLSALRPLLGEDIILWGASVVARRPGEIHPWHTDIESSAPNGRFVSAWIGLENTTRDSSLKLITRSHMFGVTIQQVLYESGLRRGQASDEMVEAWARGRDPFSRLVQPEIQDGQAILFDGRLWHASDNRGPGLRRALLLQYAAADTKVFVPDFNQLEWPFRFTELRPPSLVVSGSADGSLNRLMEPPPAPARNMIWSNARALELPLAEDPVQRWRPYSIFQGATASVEFMSCHVSVLSPGHSPHPPHAHAEEELLVALDGEADLLISDSSNLTQARIERLRPGAFVYYPRFQYHTIRNSQDAPITYLMFKWWSARVNAGRPFGTNIVNFGTLAAESRSQPFTLQILFEHQTSYLAKLHAHLTDLQPGAGYPAHTDHYDVGIVMLSGKVETMGKVIGPHGTLYFSAGEPHDMKNIGAEPARYLVFEFHALPKSPEVAKQQQEMSQ